ncbi:MAG: dependent oxidoreductase, partial [Myxococcaceae bacterium]|nr:dependent oxidoreductase [Myxococcaceae bacterium]
MAGLSAAYHLLGRSPGARVVVLEATRIGAGASGRSTGMLGPGVGQSLPALVKSRGPAAARALYRATLRAVDDVEALVKSEGLDCELERTGQLVIARSGTRLTQLAALLEELGLPGQALDEAALARRITLTPARLKQGPAAVLLPDAGTLHPGKLLAGLAQRIVARGGTILEGAKVTSVGRDRPVRLQLDGGGEVIADDVVIATAGYTPGLGLLHGRVLPVHLQVVVTEPLQPEALAAIGWKHREGVLDARRIFNYFRLTSDDRIVFGGGAPRYQWAGGLDDAGAAKALGRLEAELHRTFPAKLKVAGGWTGVIGYVADALPAIERWVDNAAVVHVVGWCGHGVALSLASGAWVTKLLCDGAVSEDLPWYRSNPPLVPLEPVRWLSFRAAVGVMGMLDQLG